MANFCYDKFDDQALIALVREHRFLYDKNQRLFKIPTAKMRAWKEIGAKLQTPPKDCMRRWSVLRDRFTKSCRSLDAPDKEFDNWHLYDCMRFLREHIVQRRFDKRQCSEQTRYDYDEVMMDFPDTPKCESIDTSNVGVILNESDLPQFAVEILQPGGNLKKQIKLERVQPESANEDYEEDHNETMHENEQFLDELDTLEDMFDEPRRKRAQSQTTANFLNTETPAHFLTLQRERLELQKEKMKLESQQFERTMLLKEKQFELEKKTQEKELELKELDIKLKHRLLKYEVDKRCCKNCKI